MLEAVGSWSSGGWTDFSSLTILIHWCKYAAYIEHCEKFKRYSQCSLYVRCHEFCDDYRVTETKKGARLHAKSMVSNLGPKGDHHQFSPNNISRSWRVKVLRITKLIT